ncbi:MAG TPA: hypothetical protein VM115_11755 [Vicinamibacterales bacterium]|nr:hypothetical protein [Vicinamibacterales bacterium]
MRIGAAVVGSVVGSASARICLLLVALLAAGCSRGELFRQYEYEEEIYLSLDGSATVYVNSSVAALDALRGASFDASSNATISREDVGTWFTTPVTTVTRRPNLSRRSGRRFLHVRLDVDDITRLSDAAPFAWSSYSFTRDGELFVYRQTVGPSAAKPVTEVGWKGTETVAFRLHLPSDIVYSNARPEDHKRGNILVWEQSLADRLRGEPLAFDVRIASQSILSRTLLLFGATFVAVAITFALVVWWVVRRGRERGSV